MKNTVLLFAFCVLMLAAGCMRDDVTDPRPVGEGETWLTIGFGDRSYDRVDVTTRAVLGQIAESRVMNLYVFIFDANGRRVYGHYFDSALLAGSRSEVESAQRECWYVENMSGTVSATSGSIRARAPFIGAGGEIFIISNIDADMVNISPEQLNYIHSKADLDNLSASLNQLITSRNGYFPMSGSKGGISIDKDGIKADDKLGFTVPLYRLDAKVEFEIKIAKGTSSSTDVDYDADGETSPAVRTQSIVEFRPESWQVMNLPRGCFIREHAKVATQDKDEFDSPTGYFDSDAVNFEKISSESCGFAFYMLENRPNKKNPAGTFHGRDLRCKDDDGAYDNSAGLWVNAPEEGTYLIIKGEVVMDVNVSSEAKAQQLNAAVTYYIHLGDFGGKTGSIDNYDIERNTSYKYTITINGVNSIQAEVEKGVEDEPAATGHVYIAKESIHTFDAHYGQRAFSFDEAYITPATVTWYVKTPFGREGTPVIINGVEVPNGLDYEWVHFMVNEHSNPDDPTSSYSPVHRRYSPQEAMNVLDFVAYIKNQKSRFDARKIAYPDDPSQWIVGNDFRPEIDNDYDEGQRTRYRIWTTVFVDEYYYEEDPISGDKSPTLWKRFINQPNRVMHLLCDTNFSSDRESSTTGSVVTIRQRSIQSIFDPDAGVDSAWGCETVDETADRKMWFYDSGESTSSVPSGVDIDAKYGNDSEINGLYNSVRLWGLVENGKFQTGHSWDEFLDVERENDHELYQLKDDATHATLRYACLMRNRDNNGDGLVDASELRWYLAAIRQITNLYIGQVGISGDAILYPLSRAALYQTLGDKPDDDGFFPWRSHIITSTSDLQGGTGRPTVVWVEEGLSTSAYRKPEDWSQSGSYSIRCVRRLGNDPQTESEAQAGVESSESHFTPVVSASGPGIGDNTATPTSESVYRFDLTNMNHKSVRFYTTKELEVADEYSEMSRPYLSFETGPMCGEQYTYYALSEMLQSGQSPCPEGYRVPNMRELSIISEYVPSAWWSGAIVCSNYYSIQTDKYWIATYKHLNQSNATGAYNVRCVRDVK